MQELQTCLQSCSSRLSFNPVVHKGYWHTAIVRVTTAGQAMLVVCVHPQDLSSVSGGFLYCFLIEDILIHHIVNIVMAVFAVSIFVITSFMFCVLFLTACIKILLLSTSDLMFVVHNHRG